MFKKFAQLALVPGQTLAVSAIFKDHWLRLRVRNLSIRIVRDDCPDSRLESNLNWQLEISFWPGRLAQEVKLEKRMDL